MEKKRQTGKEQHLESYRIHGVLRDKDRDILGRNLGILWIEIVTNTSEIPLEEIAELCPDLRSIVSIDALCPSSTTVSRANTRS